MFLCAVFVIPTQNVDLWEKESYSGITANRIEISTRGILVHVRESASPLIFQMKSAKRISGFRISGEFEGLPKFKDAARQGEKGADDYALRLGFVVPGNKHLSGFEKLFAAGWVKRLYSKVPDGEGIDHIEFFNVTQNAAQVGRSRVHPLSNLIHETFFTHVATSGRFDYSYVLKEPVEVAAVWLSIDGDDTKSSFDVLIDKIELKESAVPSKAEETSRSF